MSVESVVKEPGDMPPTSLQCAFDAANATSRPSTKIGATSDTSERCDPPPMYGSFVTTMSPGSSRPSHLSSTASTLVESMPMKPVTPWPCVTSRAFASVSPVAKSSTS